MSQSEKNDAKKAKKPAKGKAENGGRGRGRRGGGRGRKKESLIFLPLGGAGEIGMNCYVYGYGEPGRERLIVVDLGVTFPTMDGTPGVDLIFADLDWLVERRAQIEAIFITHAHEDHVGAVSLLWDQLRVPVYARPFTSHIARRKMEERGESPDEVITVRPWPEMIEAGPFTVSFVPISHSIPESSGLVIDTPAGRVVHTGDFKLDETPVEGEPFDPELWAEIAKPGVQALVCDSTNVFTERPNKSEMSVGPEIRKLVASVEGMMVATTFASNVARLKTLADAGIAAGRKVCLMGRAMQRMIEAARETGVVTDFPATISAEEAKDVAREKLMLIVTGSQGERRAASAQLARGKYQGISLKEGDTFLFSSKTIPGNERGVIAIMNAFSEMGVDVISEDMSIFHVSGHANRPDLERMHEIIRPKMLIPMHGEHRHLREHVKLARAKGLQAEVVTNGMMADIGGEAPKIVEHVEAGRVYLDGKVKIGALDGIVRDRLRLAMNGHVTVSLILEGDEPLGEPWVEIMGLRDIDRSGAPLAELIEGDLDQLLQRADARTLHNDEKLEETLKRAVRRLVSDEIGKKPEVTVIISRLE